MTVRYSKMLATLFGCAALTTMVGCAGDVVDQNHKQYVVEAAARTNALRTPLLLQSAQRGYFDTGDLDQAEKTLGDALAKDPSSPELHLLSGRVALERGQLERSFHELDQSIKLGPKLAALRYYEGLVLQRWQRYDAALEQYHLAYTLAPDNVAYLLAEAEMDVALDRADQGLNLLANKVAYFDQNAGIRVGMGHLYLLKHDYAKAADLFRQALILKPDDTQIAENLALAQFAGGQFDAAIVTLQTLNAQAGMAERHDLQRLLASAFAQAGRLDEAKVVCLKLTQTDPSDDRAWLHLGEICLTQGEIAGAWQAANRVIALAPRSHEGFLLAGIVQQRRGQTEQALKNFDRAAELDPQSAAPLIARGLLLEQSGQEADAIKAYSEALRRQPEGTRAAQLLAGAPIPIEP